MNASRSRLYRACVFSTLFLFFFLFAACSKPSDARTPGASPPARAVDTGTSGDTGARSALHPHAAYARLQQAAERYRRLAEQGGWPEVPPGDLLEEGDTSARVAPLRERLAATGDLADAAAGDHAYDARLAEAVRHFQRRHGLTVDGLLGPNTVAALNVSARERLRKIELNLERWNTVPDTLGERYVLVNIPEFRLRAYRGGEPDVTMDVIVGAEYDGRATPVFRDRMEYVIFSPYWNIPGSIANEEILPEAREDRSYLTENDYEIVSRYGPDGEVYDVQTTDLDRVASGELRLRQEPGPENALGLVKFMFPNQHAIYLHGTPEDQLFDEARRDFSHGCIRVERPVDLARFVLSRQPEWTPDRIRQAMHDGEWQRVDLQETIPVYILYFTVFVDPDGTVQFRKDLYGMDDGDPGFDLG